MFDYDKILQYFESNALLVNIYYKKYIYIYL